MANRFDQAPQISFRQRPSTYVPQEFIGIPLEYLAGSLDKRQKEFDTATIQNTNQQSLFKPTGLRQVTAYGQQLALDDYDISQTINQKYIQKSNELNERLAQGDYRAIKEIHKLGQEYQKDPYLKAINEREKYYNDVYVPLEKKQYKTEAEYYDLERKKFEFAKNKGLGAWGTPQTYEYYDNVGETEKMFAGTAFDSKIKESLGAALQYIEDGQGNRVPVLVERTDEKNKRTADKLYATFINGFQGNKALQESVSRNALAELYKAKNLGGSITITNKDNKPETFKVTDENFNDLYRKKFNEQMTDLMWYGVNKYKTIEGGTILNYSQLSKDYLDLFGFGPGNPKKKELEATSTESGTVDLGKYKDTKGGLLGLGWVEKGETYGEAVSKAFKDPTNKENNQLLAHYRSVIGGDSKIKEGWEKYKTTYPNETYDDYLKFVADNVGSWRWHKLDEFGLPLEYAQNLFSKVSQGTLTQREELTVNNISGIAGKEGHTMQTIFQLLPEQQGAKTDPKNTRLEQAFGLRSLNINYVPKNSEEIITESVNGPNAYKVIKSLIQDYPKILDRDKPAISYHIGAGVASNATNKNNTSIADVMINPNILDFNDKDAVSEQFFDPITGKNYMLSRNKMSPNTIIISTVDKKSTTTIDSNSITTDKFAIEHLGNFFLDANNP